MSKIPLSFSRLSVYRQCPKQFESKYLTKTYPDESDNPAFKKGNEVHKQLENYILYKKGGKQPALGNIATNVVPIIDSLFATHDADQIFAESQVALNHEYKECTWFGSTEVVRWRAIYDMVIFAGDVCYLLDFKTGKVRSYDDDWGQLHLSAMLVFEAHPSINTVKCAYLFAEHKHTIEVTFTRDDHPKTKAHFDIEWESINEEKEWPATKNKYCFFCKVPDCEFNPL